MGALLSSVFVDVQGLPGGDDYKGDLGAGAGVAQLVVLGLLYGNVLFFASNLISSGSELLLLIPSLAGIVGSVVLPVLGAVPDGAIVLFSGLGPREKVQKQLSVGVGALAGSTIMLLTLPFGLSILAGRVNLVNGKPTYKGAKRLNPPGRMSDTGVGTSSEIPYCGKMMMFTAVSYLIIQIPGFFHRCVMTDTLDEMECARGERWFALGGLLCCMFFFFNYLRDQVSRSHTSQAQTDKIEQVRRQNLGKLVSLRGLVGMINSETRHLLDSPTSTGPDSVALKDLIRPFFKRYDANGDGRIDDLELANLLRDLGEEPSPTEVANLVREVDTDNSGAIDIDEFLTVVRRIVKADNDLTSIQTQKEEESGEEEEEELEVPSDLASLSVEEQRKRIMSRSLGMMGLGTVIVLIFSDPMVDVLSQFGNLIGVSPFYISFFLAPIASNASELLASMAYAGKKTQKTISISMSALLGAASMNNTFCLAIFLLIVFWKQLAWEFTAETFSILFAEVIMFFVAQRRVMPTWYAYPILALFPLSVIIVMLLEKLGFD